MILNLIINKEISKITNLGDSQIKIKIKVLIDKEIKINKEEIKLKEEVEIIKDFNHNLLSEEEDWVLNKKIKM